MSKFKSLPNLGKRSPLRGKKDPFVGRKYRSWGSPLPKVERLEKWAEGADPEMTLPERLVDKALTIQNYDYESQVPAPGARLDFLVRLGTPGVAIRVQGEYWHTLGNRQATDLIQSLKLRGAGYRIFDAWEQAVYDHVLNGSILDWIDSELVKAR